ncbi:MAG TPA: enoyl-CoA hydratase/isomerase family protein [Candidatus Acidoferrales bacterium]|nr:enoyl-CoA hydratase/isomerase family protein [Candidatus Acidoferrales bacterium]
MADAILREKEDDVTTITLNRPEVGNRLTDAQLQDLAGMIDASANDSKLTVLKSAGPDFCLGREAMGQQPPHIEAYAMRERIDVILNLYGAFRRSQVPIIGAVQGKAAGLGCAIAALCDVTLATSDARFQLPEMAHKIMPSLAMSALIDRVPRKALMYLVYSTEEIGAELALSFGLVSRVVPAGKLEPELAEFIQKLRPYSAAALMGVKEYASAAYEMNASGATTFARNIHATINSSSAIRG